MGKRTGCALAVAGVLTLCGSGVASAHTFTQRFAQADSASGAMFRWWWPGAQVDDAELVAELKSIADAGYKGVEIADVMDSVDYPVDPDAYGYGTERWNHAVETALTAADKLGLQVDLTLGAHWPAAVPGLNVDGPDSSKELAYATQVVRGPFKGAVPAPAAKTYDDRASVNGVIAHATKTAATSFVGVTAVACADAVCTGTPLAVDLTSRVDLSGRVRNGVLEWTPPDSRPWVITGLWARGTAQRNDAPFGFSAMLITDPESRVVDHFSAGGTAAFLRYFDSLITPRTRALLRRTGGSLFEDSLELDFTQAWTPDFLREFERRRGYSLVPYLAVLAKDPPPNPFAPSSPAFTFSGEGATINARVTRDVHLTIGDLYLEDHVEPLQRYANRLGLTYRAQPYGETIDLPAAAAAIDVPECETLGCPAADDWRALAAGNDMAGKTILSDEALPDGFGAVYGVTQQDVVRMANDQYAAGANQMVFHGFPYATWPTSADGSIVDDASRWPGYHAFGAGIPEPFGPRQPGWTMARDTGAYYARTQLALQTGRRQTDVAVFNQSLDHVSGGFADPGLAAAGYTYGYVSPGSLALPSARVSGRRLAPTGPAFKALVLESATLDLATAWRIRGLADDGLPVIVVGAAPSATPGYAANPAASDAALRAVVASLLAERSVVRVASEAEVPGKLRALGLTPDAAASGLRTVHRVDDGEDLVYVQNPSSSPVSTMLSVDGRGEPSVLDAWTGAIRPVASYVVDGDRTRIPVTLPAGGTTIIALDHGAALHVTDTTADSAVADGRDLAVRALANGPVTTKLSNGRTVRSTVSGLPGTITPTSWDLAVDDYRPGTGSSSSTVHVPWLLRGQALVAWSAIPQLTDSSGVGVYSTTVSLGGRWSGAYLDLGAVGGAYRVAVNGRSVGAVDQLGARIDLGPYLRSGVNRLEVTVATTLLNRLRVHRPAEFAARAKQAYGLLGPVRVLPYAEVPVT